MSTRVPRRSQIIAAVIGNAFEWYDFIVFGSLSVVISGLFFPASSEYTALLLTLATFGVGYIMRPVGALVLGVYADRAGRKACLQLVISLMTVAVALIAFAPTYASIGIGAPVLIVLGRLLQGFATGGEFSSATCFLVESAPAHRAGFVGSLQMVGQASGVLLGAVMGMIVTHVLAPEQVAEWGWRIPFLVGLLIGPVGLYMRRHLEETDEFRALRGSRGAFVAMRTLDREHRRAVSASFLAAACGTTAAYVVLFYMPIYARTQLAIPLVDGFAAQVIALAWTILLIPVFGALSDRIGRRQVLIWATLGYFLLAYPLFAWVRAEPSFARLLGLQLAMCTAVAGLFGPGSTVIAEQFPAALRSTGTAIAYNFAVMLFGGFAPLIVTWLIRETGSPIAPAFYTMFGACVGIVGALMLRERVHPVAARETVSGLG